MSFVPIFAAAFDLVFQVIYMVLSNLRGFADKVMVGCRYYRLRLVWFSFLCSDRGTVGGFTLRGQARFKVWPRVFFS